MTAACFLHLCVLSGWESNDSVHHLRGQTSKVGFITAEIAGCHRPKYLPPKLHLLISSLSSMNISHECINRAAYSTAANLHQWPITALERKKKSIFSTDHHYKRGHYKALDTRPGTANQVNFTICIMIHYHFFYQHLEMLLLCVWAPFSSHRTCTLACFRLNMVTSHRLIGAERSHFQSQAASQWTQMWVSKNWNPTLACLIKTGPVLWHLFTLFTKCF